MVFNAIIITILSYLILKESVSVVQVFGIVIIVAGVALISVFGPTHQLTPKKVLNGKVEPLIID